MEQESSSIGSIWLDCLRRSGKIEIRRSPLHRWGVFSVAPIKQWELLEESPYVREDRFLLQEAGRIYDYTYGLDDDTLLVAMGYSGLYNHSPEPNTSYEYDRVNEVLRHYALRDIDAGEELTIDYGPENAARLIG